ncbi:unnamed protein product [Ceratitis capitata]|uniref:(Mediterranean fruit fly) hypothetical protein n=1 Tax=Ceratitis capitata TaxID=7213 RepID=A0A811V5I8_CERCA|nr:unnamed protein product [Ceratitis capitata]
MPYLVLSIQPPTPPPNVLVPVHQPDRCALSDECAKSKKHHHHHQPAAGTKPRQTAQAQLTRVK